MSASPNGKGLLYMPFLRPLIHFVLLAPLLELSLNDRDNTQVPKNAIWGTHKRQPHTAMAMRTMRNNAHETSRQKRVERRNAERYKSLNSRFS